MTTSHSSHATSAQMPFWLFEALLEVFFLKASTLVLLLCAVVAGCSGCRTAALVLGAVCFLQGCRALLWSVAYRNTRRSMK